MAKYNKTQLYFYKLPSTFFKRDEMVWLKEKNDGHKIIGIYLELIFETINKEGILARKIANHLYGYTIDEIARLINESAEDVKNAIDELIYLNFIEIKSTDEKDNPIYYLEESLDLTNQSVSARKKELQRKGNNCPPDIDKEKEEEIEERKKNIEERRYKQEPEEDVVLTAAGAVSEFDLVLYNDLINEVEINYGRKLKKIEVNKVISLIKYYGELAFKSALETSVFNDVKKIPYIEGVLKKSYE